MREKRKEKKERISHCIKILWPNGGSFLSFIWLRLTILLFLVLRYSKHQACLDQKTTAAYLVVPSALMNSPCGSSTLMIAILPPSTCKKGETSTTSGGAPRHWKPERNFSSKDLESLYFHHTNKISELKVKAV